MHKTKTANFTVSEKILDSILHGRYTGLYYALIKLKIPQLLHSKERTLQELANHTESNADALGRVLRACRIDGVILEKAGVYYLTEKGYVLFPDSENSLADLIVWVFEWKRKVWDNILYSVKTGKPAFDEIYGSSLFDFLQKNPDVQALFNRVMKQRTALDTKKILNYYDFSGFKVIADIGGNDGYLLSEILKQNQNLQGILFDNNKSVGANSSAYFQSPALIDRYQYVEGDFFEAVPVKADLYILKEVLHDWDHNKAEEILHNLRKIMKRSSKLLIIEQAIDYEQPASTLLDVSMLLTTGGRERSVDEFSKLLKKAGLSFCKLYKTNSALKMIECKPG